MLFSFPWLFSTSVVLSISNAKTSTISLENTLLRTCTLHKQLDFQTPLQSIFLNRMWESSPADQADSYDRNLLERNKFSDVEKFDLLRGISITVAGIKVNGNPRSSKEEFASIMLGYYHQRLVLDLKIYGSGIAANLTLDMIKKSSGDTEEVKQESVSSDCKGRNKSC